MASLENCLDQQLGRGRACFSREEALQELELFSREAKSLKPLDPAAKPLAAALAASQEKNARWMLLINERAEVDQAFNACRLFCSLSYPSSRSPT